MFNKKMRRLAAAALGAAVLMSAGVQALPNQTAVATAAEDTEDNSVQLNIASSDEDDEGENGEAQTETEEQTEAKIVYETLETTKTDEAALSAIDVSSVVENTMPSIVAITGTSVQKVESYFYGTQEYEVQGAGSGIIIAQNDSELLIATNNHVVADTSELTICFTVDAEDKEDLLAPAVIKGTNSKYDLAVVAVNIADIKEDVFKQLKIATLGSSEKLKVGEAAIVIGNALGVGQTVTTGIISAMDREITTEAGTFTELQTDAAINLGCSGGAILNAKGEVVAITDAKATGQYAESMGYGIGIDSAIPVLKDLINRQTRSTVDNHGFLGITVVPVSEEAIKMYNMPQGAFVYEVSEDSAAAAAGIRKGDIVTKFDGIDITSSDELVKTIGYYEVGETVKVEIQRQENGAYVAQEVEVTLQQGAVTEEKEEKKAEEKLQEEQRDQAPQGQAPQGQPFPDDGFDPYADEDDSFGSFDDFGQFFFGDDFGGGQNGQNDGNGWF